MQSSNLPFAFNDNLSQSSTSAQCSGFDIQWAKWNDFQNNYFDPFCERLFNRNDKFKPIEEGLLNQFSESSFKEISSHQNLVHKLIVLLNSYLSQRIIPKIDASNKSDSSFMDRPNGANNRTDIWYGKNIPIGEVKTKSLESDETSFFNK